MEFPISCLQHLIFNTVSKGNTLKLARNLTFLENHPKFRNVMLFRIFLHLGVLILREMHPRSPMEDNTYWQYLTVFVIYSVQ